jgi:hypothetical protein
MYFTPNCARRTVAQKKSARAWAGFAPAGSTNRHLDELPAGWVPTNAAKFTSLEA